MIDPIAGLNENLADVKRLMEIHLGEAGPTRGRKYRLEPLNKSGVVLTVACWEAFVEDCAIGAFDFLLDNAPTPSGFPEEVRRFVAKHLKEDKNDLAVWRLADAGWRPELAKYRDGVIRKYVGPLNTPSAHNVDQLFAELVGLHDVSKCWQRFKMSPTDARDRLKRLISLRGDIAHRVAATRSVVKDDVTNAVDLVGTLAALTSNLVRSHVHGICTKYPWPAQPEPPKAGRPRKDGAVSSVMPPTA